MSRLSHTISDAFSCIRNKLPAARRERPIGGVLPAGLWVCFVGVGKAEIG